MSIVIVDYGAGNTRSVRAALSRLGRESVVSADPDVIRDASHVVLPGVGSAKAAMSHLQATGADDAIRARYLSERPVLGICLGLQLALGRSEEDGGVDGLGIITGVVRLLDDERRPRLGWARVEPYGEAFYFAHSYYADTPRATDFALGVTAIAERRSFLGVQFHPEKSGEAGLEFLESWCSRV